MSVRIEGRWYNDTDHAVSCADRRAVGSPLRNCVCNSHVSGATRQTSQKMVGGSIARAKQLAEGAGPSEAGFSPKAPAKSAFIYNSLGAMSAFKLRMQCRSARPRHCRRGDCHQRASLRSPQCPALLTIAGLIEVANALYELPEIRVLLDKAIASRPVNGRALSRWDQDLAL